MHKHIWVYMKNEATIVWLSRWKVLRSDNAFTTCLIVFLLCFRKYKTDSELKQCKFFWMICYSTFIIVENLRIVGHIYLDLTQQSVRVIVCLVSLCLQLNPLFTTWLNLVSSQVSPLPTLSPSCYDRLPAPLISVTSTSRSHYCISPPTSPSACSAVTSQTCICGRVHYLSSILPLSSQHLDLHLNLPLSRFGVNSSQFESRHQSSRRSTWSFCYFCYLLLFKLLSLPKLLPLLPFRRFELLPLSFVASSCIRSLLISQLIQSCFHRFTNFLTVIFFYQLLRSAVFPPLYRFGQTTTVSGHRCSNQVLPDKRTVFSPS